MYTQFVTVCTCILAIFYLHMRMLHMYMYNVHTVFSVHVMVSLCVCVCVCVMLSVVLSSQHLWPVIMFFTVIVGVPWLLWRLLSSVGKRVHACTVGLRRGGGVGV